MPLPPADGWLVPRRPEVPTLYRAAAWALVLSAVRSSSGLPSFRAGLGPRTCEPDRITGASTPKFFKSPHPGPPVSCATVEGKAMDPACPRLYPLRGTLCLRHIRVPHARAQGSDGPCHPLSSLHHPRLSLSLLAPLCPPQCSQPESSRLAPLHR